MYTLNRVKMCMKCSEVVPWDGDCAYEHFKKIGVQIIARAEKTCNTRDRLKRESDELRSRVKEKEGGADDVSTGVEAGNFMDTAQEEVTMRGRSGPHQKGLTY